MSDQEKALCPAASPYEPGWNDCDHIRGERIDEVAGSLPCPDEQAKDHENCEIWRKAQDKAPAAGVEIINLASKRRTMILTADDGMDSIVSAWTKIAKEVGELYQKVFEDWLDSPVGQQVLNRVLTDILTHPEEEGGA